MLLGPLASFIIRSATGTKKPAQKAASFVSGESKTVQTGMKKIPTIKRKNISSEKLVNLKPVDKAQQQLSKDKSETGTPLDASFNSINQTLSSILVIISDTNNFKKDKVSSRQRKEKKDRKKIREAMLEGAGRARREALGKLKGVSKPAFLDSIGQYFKNILIGSLVLFVINQYERIKKFVEDVFVKVKEIFEFLQPVLTPIWDTLKWITSEGLKLIAPLVGYDVEKQKFDTELVKERIGQVLGFTKNVVKLFASIGTFFGLLSTNPAAAKEFNPEDPKNQSPKPQEVVKKPPQPAPQPEIEVTEDASTPAPTPPPAPPTVSPPAPPSAGAYTPEDYRVAAALATEAGRGQSAVDVLQVAQNRVAYPGYGNNLTEVFGAPNQFEGVFKRSIPQFFKIQTAEDAAKFVGVSVSVIEGYLSDMMNKSYQRAAAKFVGGALEFRGAPSLVRRLNSDNNPKNDIQADSRGIIPGSVWRGSEKDNQFLVDPKLDPMLKSGPAKFNLSSISRSASYDRQYMAAAVIVPLPQQQQVAQVQQGDTQVIPIFSSVNNDYGELFGNSLYKV